MKILTVANEKGGVGKTFIACQFAFYCAQKFRLRTAVIDLDQQGNASRCLEASGLAVKEKIQATDLLIGGDELQELSALHERFVYFEADKRLSLLEKQGDSAHGVFVDNLLAALKKLEHAFDVVIIDTNPNPDIRSNAGLLVCTHLVSPIQLTKEPIDGIAALFDRIEEISALNPNLPEGFIGIFLNMVDSSDFQMQNGKALIEQFGKLLISVDEVKPVFYRDTDGTVKPKLDESGSIFCNHSRIYGAVRRHAGIAEAQALGRPIWEMETQKNAWAEMKRVFFAILEAMDVDRRYEPTAEMKSVLEECKGLYGEAWRNMLRQFWMMDNSSILVGLTPEKIRLLRQLRGYVPLSVLKDGQ